MRNASLFLTLGFLACCGSTHAAGAFGSETTRQQAPPGIGQTAPSAGTIDASGPIRREQVWHVAQAAPAEAPVAGQGGRAEAPLVDGLPVAPTPDRVQELEAEVTRLRTDLQAARSAVDELRTRAEAESDLAGESLQLVIGLALLCGGIALGWFRGRRQMARGAAPRTKSAPLTRSSDTAAAPASAPAPARFSVPAALNPRDSAAATEPGRTSSRPAEFATRPGVPSDSGSPAERDSGQADLVGSTETSPSAAAPARPKRGRVKVGDPSPAARAEARALAERYRASIEKAATADASADAPDTATDPALDEWIDLEQQAEFFVVLGEDATAIQLLEDHLASDGDSPLPYLKLLEIHRRRNDREAYESTRERFNARFDALAPGWSVDGSAGRSLEDYPETLRELQAVWSDADAAATRLDAMLFKRSASDGDAFDFRAYRDLLFLHAIARDLAGPRSPEREASRGSAPPVVAAESLEIDLLLPLDEDAAVITSGPIEPVRPDDPPTEPTGSDSGALDLDVSGWVDDSGQPARPRHTHRASGADRPH
jgi:pilus assembly protein FimV